MGLIHRLNENIIGKIAAGEVVERPAAAIKELVENSLDAGATAITVEIREGGTDYFRVTDNGCGIDGSDIRMAFERHATSKIRDEKELDAIGTLGFRGEALASIAAVGKVTMTTRTPSEETGFRVRNEGGIIQSVEESACPVGTTIAVKEIFYNVPVRKGFMKRPQTEAMAVSEIMMHLILSRPDISFRYISNEKVVYHSSGDGQISSAIQSIYGTQALRSMRKVEGHENGVMIRGYVGLGENARGNRSAESFFVNGRIMQSTVLSSAIEEACRERVMIGKFPLCVLYLKLPFESVDVNVHPNKLTVRFRDDAAVAGAILNTVRDAIRERDAFEKPVEMKLEKEKESIYSQPEQIRENGRIPLPDLGSRVEIGGKVPRTEGQTFTRPDPVFRSVNPGKTAYDDQRGTEARASEPSHTPAQLQPPEPPHKSASEERTEQISTILPEIPKPLKIFGAVFNTFILCEYEDQLLLIDQHAVHERLLYEKLMKEHADKRFGQQMLVPVVVSVTKKEQALLENNRELLEDIGLTVEPFGENDVAVRSVPVVLGKNETELYLREILDELDAGREPGYEKKRAAVLQMACKHAVKGGEPLEESDLRHLIDEMIRTKVTPTCPHGRPLVVSISHYELDKKFKRIQ